MNAGKELATSSQPRPPLSQSRIRDPVMDQSTPPPPPVAVLQLVLNVWAAQSAATFARLGMADLLAEGPAPASLVAERAGTNPDATYRLLRGLATVGIVEALADGRFGLT